MSLAWSQNQNAGGSGYWQLARRHDWAPTEHATTILSKNSPHTTAMEVVVNVQLLQG